VKQLRIKPIDELGAGMAGSEASPDPSNSSPGGDISLLKEAVNKLSLSNLAGPYSAGGLGVDPWGGRLPMRPSLTGNAERTAPSHTMPARQPLQASLTGGTARARPRAYTPTNQLFSHTLQTRVGSMCLRMSNHPLCSLSAVHQTRRPTLNMPCTVARVLDRTVSHRWVVDFDRRTV
jgi:hypothetical protein